MELRGIEPRTFHMRSEHSTSELQPLSENRFPILKLKLNVFELITGSGLSSSLRKAIATVISNGLCQSYFGPAYVTSGTICTRYSGAGTCSVIK